MESCDLGGQEPPWSKGPTDPRDSGPKGPTYAERQETMYQQFEQLHQSPRTNSKKIIYNQREQLYFLLETLARNILWTCTNRCICTMGPPKTGPKRGMSLASATVGPCHRHTVDAMSLLYTALCQRGHSCQERAITTSAIRSRPAILSRLIF